MFKEFTIAAAKIIESRVSVFVLHKAKARTFSMAGKEPFTFFALLWQRVLFICSKSFLFWRIGYFDKSSLVYVSYFVFGKDKMIAGVNVTIKFHCSSMSTGFCQCTYSWRYSHPVGQSSIEELYIVFSYIMSYPLIKDFAKKVSPLFGCDTKIPYF